MYSNIYSTTKYKAMHIPLLALQINASPEEESIKTLSIVGLLFWAMQFRCVEASVVDQVIVVVTKGNHNGMWNQLSEKK